MRFLPARAPAVLSFLFALSCLLTNHVRADLVWTKQTGWRVEGGALSGLAGTEGRNALDAMNKARDAEESKRNGSAISTYETVAKKWPNSVYAPEALYRAARIRLVAGQYNKAF